MWDDSIRGGGEVKKGMIKNWNILPGTDALHGNVLFVLIFRIRGLDVHTVYIQDTQTLPSNNKN